MKRLHLCLAGAAFSVGLALGLLLPAYAAFVRTLEDDHYEQPVFSEHPSPLESAPTEGVFWSAAVERLLPAGFTERDLRQWRRFVNETPVVRVDNGCGRMQNRLVTFATGQRSCGRYRQNNDQIQGEIFSYYLSRLLALRNLPPAVLTVAKGPRWTSVEPHLELAHWNPARPLVLTQFVDNLAPAFIPPAFRNASRRLHPQDVTTRSDSELAELAQWSDLIVFDYLTANLDRVVNNMFNEQWNSGMMTSPGHNLAVTPETGLLLFLDNESGLLHGYRLLDKYEPYHMSLLRALCVFRAPTVRRLRKLRSQDLGQLLREQLRREPAGPWLPTLPERYLKVLRQRLETVDKHVRACERRYGLK